MLFLIVIVNCCIMKATGFTVFCLALPSLNKVDKHTYIQIEHRASATEALFGIIYVAAQMPSGIV